MNRTDIQIVAVREAAQVRRCHTQEVAPGYTIGEHSFGALALLLLLHPNPSVELIKAVAFHDIGERWLGDLPATTKWTFPEIGVVYEKMEAHVLERLGLRQCLLSDEESWLRAVDTLDLWLWCRRQRAVGNVLVSAMENACEALFRQHRLEGSVPAEVLRFYEAERGRDLGGRLPDSFEHVREMLEVADGPGEAGPSAG